MIEIFFCDFATRIEAQYCGHCAKAIGDQAIERIRKRKIDFVLLGMEMDHRILDDCFNIVLTKMLQDDLFLMGIPRSKNKERILTLMKPESRNRGKKGKILTFEI